MPALAGFLGGTGVANSGGSEGASRRGMERCREFRLVRWNLGMERITINPGQCVGRRVRLRLRCGRGRRVLLRLSGAAQRGGSSALRVESCITYVLTQPGESKARLAERYS